MTATSMPSPEAIERAAAVLAVARRTRDTRTVADAARAAHRAGGPSIVKLEQLIAARRALRAA